MPKSLASLVVQKSNMYHTSTESKSQIYKPTPNTYGVGVGVTVSLGVGVGFSTLAGGGDILIGGF